MRIAESRLFLTELYAAWNAHRPSRLAAALAYYSMFSIAPMLYIALMVAGIFADEVTLADRLFEQLAQNLGPEMSQFLQDVIVSTSQSTTGAHCWPP
jgi:membrane protein